MPTPVDTKTERAKRLEALYWDLRQARERRDDLAAELAQDAINHILDHWSDAE